MSSPMFFVTRALSAPVLGEALIVEWDQPEKLVVEVQAHLDERTMPPNAACKCASGNPVTVQVGDAGRLLDVTGAARDGGPPLPPRHPRK